MATFYQGYRPILKGRNVNQQINTYTHKAGVYSNWDLFDPSHVLDGAPDTQRVPGSGPRGEGDVFLSRIFLGLDQNFSRRKNSLVGAGNPVQNDFYGRYNPDVFRGLLASRALDTTTLGHIAGGGAAAAYAEFSNYIYSGIPGINQALNTSTLGHKERYPSDTQTQGVLGPRNQPTAAAESFGAFEPYLYKGVVTKRSDPLSSAVNNLGHPYWAPSVTADNVPDDYGQIPAPRAQADHYGQEHTREWFGVPSAKAL